MASMEPIYQEFNTLK